MTNSSYIGEPQALKDAKFILSILVIVFINLDLYLVCQARDFQSLFYDAKIK